MKSLFVIIIIVKVCLSLYNKPHESENFLVIKCIFYLIISSIHSVIVSVPIPIGAIIMSIILIFDPFNKKIKSKLVLTGLIVVGCSVFSFSAISYPFQKAYLYLKTYNVHKIDVFSNSLTNEEYLFTISNDVEIKDLANNILNSTPCISWGNKVIPADTGYSLILHSGTTSTRLLLSSNSLKNYNLFIGNHYITYKNTTLLPLIQKRYPKSPVILTLQDSNKQLINIKNTNILNTLWRDVIWSSNEKIQLSEENLFNIPGYLFFKNGIGCKINFSSNFNYASLPNKNIIALSHYLSTSLQQQFVLSHLNPVKEFNNFGPAHTHNPPQSTIKYSIEQDENGLYYGLYREDLKTMEKILLHTVSSLDTQFFILTNPYILILDEKSPSQYFLLLINQNLPEKHRYIEKNQNIIPKSLAICPHNQQFTYIVNYYNESMLYIVSNYYHSPKVVASGDINDSLFLSDNYLAFTQSSNGENYFCIYDIKQAKVIRYIYIPGDITLIKSSNYKVYFAVQTNENTSLKEGIFYIDSSLTIHTVN
ncbi:MAG: hypothetical protein AB9856_13260 [Cellulosilyticaceae bacterium]